MNRPPTKAIEPDRYYTYHEIAECLRVSIDWIRQRRSEGLPRVELAGRVWIHGRDMVEFLKSRKVQ